MWILYKILKISDINCSSVIEQISLDKLRIMSISVYQVYLKKYFLHQFVYKMLYYNHILNIYPDIQTLPISSIVLQHKISVLLLKVTLSYQLCMLLSQNLILKQFKSNIMSLVSSYLQHSDSYWTYLEDGGSAFQELKVCFCSLQSNCNKESFEHL